MRKNSLWLDFSYFCIDYYDSLTTITITEIITDDPFHDASEKPHIYWYYEGHEICIILGTTKTLAYSIHNMVVQKHNTRLKERLSQ